MGKLLTDLLDIEHPFIVAPMFLISNVEMTVAALEGGATAAFPALNYRTDEELRKAVSDIRARTNKPFGVNLIVNKSNPKYLAQLETLVELEVDFIVTSLGSPEETIRRCKSIKTLVFCDVIDVKYAKKVETLGAHAVVAVNNTAGGHCGPTTRNELIKAIKAECNIPIISAGGIGTHSDYKETMEQGVAGVQVGTVFLASEEAPISKGYQDAIVEYGAKDIVLTEKLSGSKLTVINTPYVKKIGTKASAFQRMLLKNKTLKKYFKMIVALRGMNKIRKATFDTTYKTVYCAGPAIEHVKEIRPLKLILEDLLHGK